MNKKSFILFAAVLAVNIGMPCCMASPEIVIADPVFEAYCLAHFDRNGNKQIQKNEVKSVKSLNISGLNIHSLKGLEEFLSLECLDCSKNQLVRLYLSKNRALTALYCSQNELPVLDVSYNAKLRTLDCSNNKITVLDLSKNKALKELNCICNPLTFINVWPNFNGITGRRWHIPEYTRFRRP
jgi:Leucine-rich repeat (LRR) protein